MKERKIKAPEMPLASLNAAAPALVDTAAKQLLVGNGKGTSESALPSSPLAAKPAAAGTGGSFTSSAGDGERIVRIPLTRLKIHPFNSRDERTQNRIEEVREMLTAENKQREPITVVPGRRAEDVGFFFILSGQTRYHSANLAGWTELEARINPDIDPDDHLAFWAASLEHNTSVKESDWDIAKKANALIEEGKTPDSVRKAAKTDERGLRRLLAMTDLPEEILELVKKAPHKLTSVFCEILRRAHETLGTDQTVALAKQTIDPGLTKRALEDLVDRMIRRKQKMSGGTVKRATRIATIPILIGADKAGEFKVMASRIEGQRLLTLTADLPEHLVDAFQADIEAALAKLGRPL